MKLVVPASEHLASYVAALESGWSPDNLRDRAAAEEQIERIKQDSSSFLASLNDPLAEGLPILLPDGSFVKRLPAITRWMWDGEYCGSIGFRWQPGTSDLPPTCPGHIGFSVVPWKRRRGYAKQALAEMLGEARRQGLDRVEVTTTPDNIASQNVIEANGGVSREHYMKAPELGGGEGVRYYILLEGATQ